MKEGKTITICAADEGGKMGYNMEKNAASKADRPGTQKLEFTYPSADGKTKIHGVSYIPSGEIKAILQISHGMVEFIERYEDFALYLNEQGIMVTGNDHLGHGKSINNKTDYGYFAEPDGNRVLLDDLHSLTALTKKTRPDIPYFLLGHSMGSFYARQYLCEFGSELDGAIIMGTGFQPKLLVSTGIIITRFAAFFKGWRHRSMLVNNIAMGSYNSRFKPARTDKDWLSRDEKIVDAYRNDERCGFVFTLNAFHHMFRGIRRLYDPTLLEKMPKDLPVLFVSGTEDPVGDYSKGVILAEESFKKAGMKRTCIKLYEGDRHEILNELDRDQVYRDLADWILDKL